jgi:DNA-directed RNA polymerase specialized sigma24 family protein
VRDEESFGRYVMDAYRGLVRRGVLLVGDRGHAEDLVQVSLAAAYLHWRWVREPDAYVRTVMALKCSVGTVKSRASRALASLRANGLLAEEGHIR